MQFEKALVGGTAPLWAIKIQNNARIHHRFHLGYRMGIFYFRRQWKRNFGKLYYEHYFSHILERYLRVPGYLTKGITDFSFELNDNGQPFYVATIYEKQIG